MQLIECVLVKTPLEVLELEVANELPDGCAIKSSSDGACYVIGTPMQALHKITAPRVHSF